MSRIEIRNRQTGIARFVEPPAGMPVYVGEDEEVVGVGATPEAERVRLAAAAITAAIPRRHTGESYADAHNRALYQRGVEAEERMAAALERSAAVDERRADQIDEANGLHREQLALGRQAAARETRVLEALEAAKLAESPNAEQDAPERDLPGAEDHRLIVLRYRDGSLRVHLAQDGDVYAPGVELVGLATGRW